MSATGRNLPAAAGASPEVRQEQRPSLMRMGLAPGRRAGGPTGPGEAGGVEAEAARRERTQVFLARAAAGLGILVLWQACAATLAPGYIARPSGSWDRCRPCSAISHSGRPRAQRCSPWSKG